VAFGDEIREVHNRDDILTADAEEFKSWIGRLRANGGDDEPEISLDAVKRATQMKYRDGTQKVLILITDAPPHQKGDGTPFSQVVPEELMAQLRDQGFTVYAVAYDHPHFRRLVGETSGEFYDIHRNSDFTGIIAKIGGLIASQYRLTYISARPYYDGTRRAIEVEVAGEKGGGSYLEKHLINIRSNGIIALAFLLPLLLALVLPTAVERTRRRPQPVVESEAVRIQAPEVSGRAVCPHCGHDLRPGARFCSRCGQTLTARPAEPHPTVCPRCGHPLRLGARFCGSCGQKL
jgi:DNA-directed RNA polymerase subunit RPC12/RpoP